MLKFTRHLSWHSFYNQSKIDFGLWCYFVLFQQLCRGCFIYGLSNYLQDDTKFTTILYAMLHGLRFDSLWATCWLFFVLVFVTLPSTFLPRLSHSYAFRYRVHMGAFFTITTAVLYFAAVRYFIEYNDLFNHLMFNWFYDDKVAIIKTIYAEHHLLALITLIIILSLLYYRLANRLLGIKKVARELVQYSLFYKVISIIVIVIFYVIAFRGSVVSRPIQERDAEVTKDRVLNKAVISPYSALKYAVRNYRKRVSVVISNLSPHEIQEIAKKFFMTDKSYPKITQYLSKIARGSSLPRPKHIFLIVGESLDSWPLEKSYQEFNLLPNISRLKDQGIYIKYFLPYGYYTISALSTIIAGIPDSDLHSNYQASSIYPYLTSIAPQVKKLGFKPQAFYGGFRAWERFGDFALDQGFVADYDAKYVSKYKYSFCWGVDDQSFFDSVFAIVKNQDEPTFNLIMTTSNHEPFRINIAREGFDVTQAKRLLTKYPKSRMSVEELGHIWYGDKAIGGFIDKVSSWNEDTLFIIVGDHVGRKHLLTNPPLFEQSSVPLLIYSKNIKNYYSANQMRAFKSNVGSQIDLGATIIELLAPKGFAYYSFGSNILSKGHNIGFGENRVITKNYVAVPAKNEVGYFGRDITSPNLNSLGEKLWQLKQLSGYLVTRGDVITDEAIKFGGD